MFAISKKEQKEKIEFSTSQKKLPRNFANRVLDLELKIESNNFEIETVDALMQLYSVSRTLITILLCVVSRRVLLRDE